MTSKKDEKWVREKARKWLEKEKGCIKPRGVRFPSEKYTIRQPDLVGVTPRGKIYVVECKGGEIGRPVQGLKILYYRALIEKKFEKCMNHLKKRTGWKKGVKRATRSSLRFYLALSSNHCGVNLLKHFGKKFNIFNVKIF